MSAEPQRGPTPQVRRAAAIAGRPAAGRRWRGSLPHYLAALLRLSSVREVRSALDELDAAAPRDGPDAHRGTP